MDKETEQKMTDDRSILSNNKPIDIVLTQLLAIYQCYANFQWNRETTFAATCSYLNLFVNLITDFMI